MKFKKKPVVIEAVQWLRLNVNEIGDFLGDAQDTTHVSEGKLFIKTLEGTMEASDGDWIIKGVKNEFYPCKPDIFEKTYEPV